MTIFVLGTIVSDPVSKPTRIKSNVVQFRISCPMSETDAHGQHKSCFFNISAFGAKGDLIYKNFQKGDKIALSGQFKHIDFVKDNGSHVCILHIMATDFEFVDTDIQPHDDVSAKLVTEAIMADRMGQPL